MISFVCIWLSAGMFPTSISLLLKYHFQVYKSIKYTSMKVLCPSWILLIETKSLIKMCKMQFRIFFISGSCRLDVLVAGYDVSL
jgi:hypothetical protein